MKQFEVAAVCEFVGNRFSIRPFPALTAGNISGTLFTMFAPILASAVVNGSGSALDADLTTARGFDSFSGDKTEGLLKSLLTKHRNITVELSDGSESQVLTDDLLNEVFCGVAQNMFTLAFEVIKVNFRGFSERLESRFGNLLSGLKTMQD